MKKLSQQERIAKFKREENKDDYKYKKDGKFKVLVSVGVVLDVEAKTLKEARKLAEKEAKSKIPFARDVNAVREIKW